MVPVGVAGRNGTQAELSERVRAVAVHMRGGSVIVGGWFDKTVPIAGTTLTSKQGFDAFVGGLGTVP
jgi:hypothetical protein